MIGRVVFILIIIFLVMSPIIIAVANQIDLNKEVQSPYLNGLITACGIFVAFITASVVSKAQDLDSFDFFMMRCTLLLFTGSIVRLSYALIVDNHPTILDLLLFSSTLILASVTAWNIMHTLFRKSHSITK